MGGQRYDKRNYERSKYPDLWGMVPDRSRIGILDAKPDLQWLKPDLQELRMPETLS